MNHNKFIDSVDQTILSTEDLFKRYDWRYSKDNVKVALSRGKNNILKAVDSGLITEEEAAKIMVDNEWSFYNAYKNMGLDVPVLERKEDKTLQLYCKLDDNILDDEVDEKIETREEAMFALDMGRMIEQEYLQYSDVNGYKTPPLKIGIVEEEKKSWFKRHPRAVKYISLLIPFIFVGVGAASVFGHVDKDNTSNIYKNIENKSEQNSGDPIITVDDEPGDADYTSIQDAIDHASPGDIIKVYGGEYDENIQIYKSLTLSGVPDIKDKEPIPIINGNHGTGAKILEDNCTVDGFKIIDGLPFGAGIVIRTSNNVIENNIIENNVIGIALGYAPDYSGNVIYKNKIRNNHLWGIGIDVTEMEKYIRNKGAGNYIENNVSENIISHNGNFNGGGGLLLLSGGVAYKNDISSNNGPGVRTISQEGKVINNNILNNLEGILIDRSSHVMVEKNNIIDNKGPGIFLNGSSDNLIKHNNFLDNNPQSSFMYYYGVDENGRLWMPGKNYWNENYWNDWNSRLPRPIHGNLKLLPRRVKIPLINFDWHPSKNPN